MLLFLGTTSVFAQRGHILLYDTMHLVGNFQDIKLENETAGSFKRYTNDKYQYFSVDNVSEFSYNNRFFFRRDIINGGESKVVFLERIISSRKTVTLYRLNGKPSQYYIEQDSILVKLDQTIDLKKVFTNPDLHSLIDITHMNEVELKYLFKSASKDELLPRTFTNTVVITPNVGIGMITHQFDAFLTKDEVTLSSWSPMVGINIEAFLNFRRNISVNLGPRIIGFQNKAFYQTIYSNGRLESDLFLEYSALQVPFSLRYYHDTKPQKLRIYGEIGFLYSAINIRKARSHHAIIRGNEVQLESQDFSIPQNHKGFLIGVGAERYLYGHRGVVLGLNYSRVTESLSSSLELVQLTSGFKF